MRARPFARLMWSPQAGFLVLPLLLSAAWPLVRNHPAVAGLAAASSSDLASVLWGESVSFAVVAGYLGGLITRDLLRAPFSFIVPSLRERVFIGKAMFATLVAFALAYKLFEFLGPTGLQQAAAILSSTLLFFALGAALSDPVFPKSAVWIIGALLVVPVWEPRHVQRFFEGAPLIAPVAALVAAAVLGKREIDTDTARERMLLASGAKKSPGGTAVTKLWQSISLPPPWSGHPGTGRLREWLRAIHHENFGSWRFEWPTTVLWAVALNCGMAYALKNPSFAAIMGLMSLAIGGHRITGRWAYPLSRERRATVVWYCSLMDSVAYFAIAALVLPTIYALDLPQVSLIKSYIPRYGFIAPLAVAFIASPVVQWPRATSALAPPKMMQFGPLWLRVSFRCVSAIAIVTFLLESLFVVTDQSSIAVATAIGAVLALGFQYFYWVNLRHHFSQADLA